MQLCIIRNELKYIYIFNLWKICQTKYSCHENSQGTIYDENIILIFMAEIFDDISLPKICDKIFFDINMVGQILLAEIVDRIILAKMFDQIFLAKISSTEHIRRKYSRSNISDANTLLKASSFHLASNSRLSF